MFIRLSSPLPQGEPAVLRHPYCTGLGHPFPLYSLKARISQRSFRISELTLLQNPEKRFYEGGRRMIVTIIEKLHGIVVTKVWTRSHPTLESGPASYQEREL